MDSVFYSVIMDGGMLKCIDTSNGNVLGSINYQDKITTNPIIIGDRCTVIFDNSKGIVYKLPNFIVSTTFNA
jgi:hypothetical protein